MSFITDKKKPTCRSNRRGKKEIIASTVQTTTLQTLIKKDRLALEVKNKEKLLHLVRKITELEEEKKTLTGRHNLLRLSEIDKKINDSQKKIVALRDGVELKKFDEKTEKYKQAQLFYTEQETQLNETKRRINNTFSNFVGSQSEHSSLSHSNNIKRNLIKDATSIIKMEYMTELLGQAPPMHINQQDLCTSCGSMLLLSTNNSSLVCVNCKYAYPYIDTTTASMAYGDEVELSQFAYKKDHHLEDWIKKVQAKSNKPVDDTIVQQVREGMNGKGIKESSFTRTMCRDIMKEKGLWKYYDHCMYIWCKITGNEAPTMPQEKEETLKTMFANIQAPFQKWKMIVDPNRRNFLSYSYVLYKFCQLLQWDEYLKYFTLLKGVDKLKKQDAIWKGICEDMSWKYIESI